MGYDRALAKSGAPPPNKIVACCNEMNRYYHTENFPRGADCIRASSLSGFALHTAKQTADAVWLEFEYYKENSARRTGLCVLPVCPHVL
jgi:hypothetical protein